MANSKLDNWYYRLPDKIKQHSLHIEDIADYGGGHTTDHAFGEVKNHFLRFDRESIINNQIEKNKKIYVLGEGRLINLVAGEGHPAEVMDMSFANEALAAIFLIQNKGKLLPQVYTLPKSIDEEVARLKLEAMGVTIDSLTVEQKKYLESWKEGT